jgi:hypothetical protein
MPVEIGVDSRYLLMVGLLLIYDICSSSLPLRARCGGGLSENRKHQTCIYLFRHHLKLIRVHALILDYKKL